MIFGEVVYTTFTTITATIYWLVPRNLRITFIAVCGIVFYGYYAGWWVLLLLAISGLSWIFLFGIDQSEIETSEDDKLKKQPLLSWALLVIICSIFVLASFKYSGFIQEVFTGKRIEGVIAPLAISFFVFEFIHIASENLKGNLKKISIPEYFAFIFFPPTMIAGPIKRYDQFSLSMQKAEFKFNDLLEGLFRIILGTIKKMVIADNLNTLIQEVGTPEKTHNLLLLIGAVFLYGIRIYLDFSGYSDIAIGSARLFGLRVPENFNFPYLQTNISEFWRHWHISLYTWLVDYVYIPLGGSRVNFVHILLNIMMTMFVSGIWHGAAWNFIIWGIWHGILLCIHKVYSDYLKPMIILTITQNWLYSSISYILTMVTVFIGWSFFMWKTTDIIQYYNLIWKVVIDRA